MPSERVSAKNRLRRSFRNGVFAAGLMAAAWARAAEAAPITDLSLFRSLPADKARESVLVDLEMTVLFYDPHWRVMWAEDKGQTFWVSPGEKPHAFRSGQRIRATGRMIPAGGVSLAQAEVSVLGEAPPSSPLRVGNNAQEIDSFQARIVEMEGYLQRSVVTDKNHLLFELLCGKTLVQCRVLVPDSALVGLDRYEDARIRVTGLYIAQLTATGQISLLNLWVPNLQNVEILGSIAADTRFDVETATVEKLPALPAERLARVIALVHAVEPGKSVTLRDRTGQVRLFTPQTRPLRIGSLVEAIGSPSIQGYEWTLRDGLYRPAGTDHLPEASPEERSTLRLADQINELRPEEAARGVPVKLTGVVTWARGSSDFIYLQDPSSGIRVRLDQIRPSRDLLSTVVEVTGVTESGKFAPQVVAKSIVRSGLTNFPEPRTITLEQAMTGIEEGQWVGMRGYLRKVTFPDGLWSTLSITGAAGEFTVHMPRFESLKELVGSIVRINGVCVAEANERRELTGISLYAAVLDALQVEDPAPADPFSVPLRTLASLRQFSTMQAFNRRVRVFGQVVHHVPGHHVRFQDGNSGLLALSRDTTPLAPGDRVELVGFPGRDGSRVVLREAVYRRIARGGEPVPSPLREPQKINTDLDSRLVSIEGTLLEASQRGADRLLLVQGDGIVFEAVLDERDGPKPALAIGSRLRLTGVYQLQFDEYRHGAGFHLRLRSPSDIALLKSASWWTAKRALGAAGILFGCVLLVIVWVAALRRRVGRQTHQIREQLEKEALLQARHREIVDNASDFIFTTDLTGRLTSFNPAGERITGFTAEEALRMNLRDFIAPEDGKGPLPLLDAKPAHDGTVTFEVRFKTRDGRLIWVETNARLIRQPGQPAGVLGVARDVSARKQIEAELRRARDAAEANTKAKSSFLANMSHEIRTPMNGVIGMSNLLLDTALSDEQRDFAETIRNSAEALLTVLNDILDFSKIEAGKLTFEVIDFDLGETVESTLELMAARASSKGLELASFLPQDLPHNVRGDPGRLRQVLLNLIGNAIKFTEKGEVIVAVAVEQENAKDVRIHFEVTDTGIGLPPETQAQLFQPFSQADNSTTRKYGGTGLGLAISKQIVQLMDGQIGVRSTPGKGSTFWFTTRLERQAFDVPQEKAAPITALNGLRALVVDDNATNRKILQHYAVGWGLRSEPASGAETALSMLRVAARSGDPFQLIMLDYQMPTMDGLMFARAVHTDPDISSARMVLLTSWDRRFSRDELAEAGIVRMLVKPVRQQDLLGALLRCMRIGGGTNPGLPIVSTRDQPLPAPPARKLGPAGARPLRVLIAEDNAVNQRVALLQLQTLGHTADLAANGIEALEALERGTYDVVLMDGQMPEMDGYETTRRIRRNPRHAGLRIVAMTANAMQGDREKCLDAGMDDYVSKPTRLEDLHAALARSRTTAPVADATPTDAHPAP